MHSFGLPHDPRAAFVYEPACRGYVCMRGDVLLGLLRTERGSWCGTVTTYRVTAPLPDHPVRAADVLEAAFSVTLEAATLPALRRKFQAMVALDHDGTPDLRETGWGDGARWLALAEWDLGEDGP